MNILKLFTGEIDKTISAVGELGDKLFTSDEERLLFENKLQEIKEKAIYDAKEQSLKAEEIILKDKADARSMQEVALNQNDLFSKRFIYYYATFMTVATFGYIYAITFLAIPESSVRFADTVLGFLLGTGLASIISFFYGSSNSSQSKDAKIAKMKY